MHTEILRRLRVRHAAFLDQAHRLKLELPRKLPSLHGPPPAPSKHLTRCLRNRVQANASKLRAERVELQWGFADLYALMFFHLSRSPNARDALVAIAESAPLTFRLFSDDNQSLSSVAWYEPAQRAYFDRFAGQWMGSDRKRGATYSWLVQHLADASGE